MNWKLKYLKYKQKYINLKEKYQNENLILNPNSNPNDFFNLLKKLYPNCIKNSNETIDSTQTYGEMEYEGIENLNKLINQDNRIKYFLDIGSGRGKLPCWFAGIDNIIKSVGIEIVEQRCLDADKLKSNLSKDFPSQTSKIQLVCGSFENYNLDELVESNTDALVWISNLCFGPELTETVFTQILNQMPKGTIICCSRKPSESIDSATQHKLKFDKIIQLQMSWWNNLSDVFVYTII